MRSAARRSTASSSRCRSTSTPPATRPRRGSKPTRTACPDRQLTIRDAPVATPIASVSGAVKRYPGVTALDHVDFAIGQGEVRALLGKNGAGKSTLIRLLTGAELPDVGEVTIRGHALHAPAETRTAEAQALGVRAVYQELSLVPGMSIAENLFLGAW